MSRDWRPVELYTHDIHAKEEWGESYREMKIEWKVQNEKGEWVKVEEDEKIAALKKEVKALFPELNFFYEGQVLSLYETYKEDAVALDVLQKAEDTLKKIEDGITRDEKQHCYHLPDMKNADEFTDTVFKWFCGELDESFYYRERNDRAFHEFLTDEIDKAKGITIKKGEQEL